LKKVDLEYKKGDVIVHASHGIGTVKGITTKKIGGEKQVFYKVKTDQLTYWLPVSKSDSDRIRSMRAASTFNTTLSLIRRKPKKLNKNFRSRLKHIKEELAKCSLKSNAKLLRDLFARDLEKPLHMNENRIYEKLKRQFVNEWSMSAGISKSEAEQKLEKALYTSAEKVSTN